jgi:hypothetical protein
MNNRVISTLALAVALAASSAAVHAQSSDDTLNQNDASTTAEPSASSTSSSDLSGEMKSMVASLTQASQGEVLTGDEGSACEAIICLSTGSPPGECMASLRKYFSINLSKPWKTIQARINFLKLCPTASASPQMDTLVEAIGNGAGRCDAASLNSALRTWTGVDGEYEISNQLPSYCDAYYNHEYTDINSGTRPHYVERYVVRTIDDGEGNIRYEYEGGYWVDGPADTATANNTNGAVPASQDRAAVGSF